MVMTEYSAFMSHSITLLTPRKQKLNNGGSFGGQQTPGYIQH